MSDQITTAFVQNFKAAVMTLAQQEGSRLRNTVRVEEGVIGETHFVEQIDSTAMVQVTNRHADSPLVNTPHSRRMITLKDFDWGDLIDKKDKIRLLIDPTSPYVINAAWAAGRQIDTEIITAAFAQANTGKDGKTQVSFASDGGTTVARDFPGALAITGMTVEKTREALRILRANEVNPMEPLFMAVTALQLDNMLGTTEVTSSDFNSVKALVQGELETFLKFKWIQTELLVVDSANSDRRCIAWSKMGLALAIGQDITSRIEERADKRFSTYVFLSLTLGAERLEGKRVVEVLCDE